MNYIGIRPILLQLSRATPECEMKAKGVDDTIQPGESSERHFGGRTFSGAFAFMDCPCGELMQQLSDRLWQFADRIAMRHAPNV